MADFSITIGSPEPAFLDFSGKRLSPSPADMLSLAYLRSNIAANADHLLSHVQRVLLSSHLNCVDHIFGALVDIFLATGKHAYPLRKNLLMRCKNQIGREHFNFLCRHLITGLAHTSAPDTPYSVLAKGYISHLCAIERTIGVESGT